MARNVSQQSTPRCERCRCTLRWCICDGHESIESPLRIDVLINFKEYWRPTSTGRLITRLFPQARHHQFRPTEKLSREGIVDSQRELLILHPRGELLPTDLAPERLQVLLLDGNWREASRMTEVVGGWGRMVRLPELAEESRNRLRRQEHAGRLSTAEALIQLLLALGQEEAARRLQRQFDLHVYAGLRTRGAKTEADDFMESSQLRAAFPELIERLLQRRPLV